LATSGAQRAASGSNSKPKSLSNATESGACGLWRGAA
jgi:hypothetical protein